MCACVRIGSTDAVRGPEMGADKSVQCVLLSFLSFFLSFLPRENGAQSE